MTLVAGFKYLNMAFRQFSLFTFDRRIFARNVIIFHASLAAMANRDINFGFFIRSLELISGWDIDINNIIGLRQNFPLFPFGGGMRMFLFDGGTRPMLSYGLFLTIIILGIIYPRYIQHINIFMNFCSGRINLLFAKDVFHIYFFAFHHILLSYYFVGDDVFSLFIYYFCIPHFIYINYQYLIHIINLFSSYFTNFMNSAVSPQHIPQKTQQIINLCKKILTNNTDQKLQDEICEVFEGLLWFEKKNCCQLQQLINEGYLQHVNQKYFKQYPHLFLKCYILMMMNCRQEGKISKYIVEKHIPHQVLQMYMIATRQREQKEQCIEYIGSFLKAYNRLYAPQLLHYFVLENQYFQLLEVCFKFATCPEPLTCTTVFNIVLSLLKREEVKQFICQNTERRGFYQSSFEQLTKVLRSQLIKYKQQLQKGNMEVLMNEVEDIVTLWQDIAEAVLGLFEFVDLSFIKNVLVPLVIGPISNQINNQFSNLKFCLIILHKFIPLLASLDILNIFIHMIFVQDDLYVWPSALTKPTLKQFNIGEILNRYITLCQQQEQIVFSEGKIKNFYRSLLKSKDTHFLMLTSSFISIICSQFKKKPILKKDSGLQINSALTTSICESFISQLNETHSICTVISVINCLVLLNQSNPLNSQLQDTYIFHLKKIIQETQMGLKDPKYWEDIIECSEDDLMFCENMKLGKKAISEWKDEYLKLIMKWDPDRQSNNQYPFYYSIPDSPNQHMRYLFIKFMVVRKGCQKLLDPINLCNLPTEYYSKIVTKSPYMQGETYKLMQIKGPYLQCQIIDERSPIPTIWIKDENFFIIGFLHKEHKTVRIIASIKYKHLDAQMIKNKNRLMMTIQMKYWDYGSQRIKRKGQPLRIKGIQGALPIVMGYRTYLGQKQLTFLENSLKNTKQQLPIQSLL